MKSFLLGAVGYPLLELCWRGRTHPTMSLVGCGIITGVEAAVGLIWNRDHRIWDYRNMPGNWRGQVCVPYALLWAALSAATVALLNAAEE